MTIDLTIFEDDRKAVRDDLPIAVTFDADVVQCRRSVLSADERSASAGLLEDYVFSLHSITSEWENVPTEGELLSVGDEEYRILRVIEDSVGTRFDMAAKFTSRTRAR